MPGTANTQPLVKRQKFVEIYRRWFDVLPARDERLRDEVYRLRYQVYCMENDYEDPNEHRSGREMDRYDERSAHSLLIDRTTATPIGTVRLILPDPRTPLKSFPIQGLCRHPLLSDMKLLLNSRAAEISRFSISKKYRQLQALPNRLGNDKVLDRHLVTPFVTLGLMQAILQMSVENGVTELLAVMEPSLLRLLARFGIYFRPLGPLVEFHGMRQPCHANIEELLARTRREHTDAWDVITDEGRLLDEMRQREQRRTIRSISPLHYKGSQFLSSSV